MARIQEAYIGAPVKPARYYHRSPADLGVEEVQAYLLHFIAGSINFTGIFSETEPGRSLSKQLRSPSTRGERGEMTGILSQSFPEASGSTGAIEVKVEEGRYGHYRRRHRIDRDRNVGANQRLAV